MNIVFVMPFYADAELTPHEVLDRFPVTSLLPEAVRKRGHGVRVLLLSPVNATIRQQGVIFEFISPGKLLLLTGRLFYRWKPRYGPAYYQPGWNIARRIHQLQPDIVHIFGMTIDIQLALVAAVTSRRGIPLFVHYHGGTPETSASLRALQHWNFQRIDKALFTSLEQADPWIQAGLLDAPAQVGQLMETSSPFSGMDRERARASTGMFGRPVCLSAGRLHPIKDPLTVFRGFQRIVQDLPEARLYCYYLTAEMLPEIEELLATDAALAERVELRGKAPLAEMEAVYSSADYLLQASTREWSGLAVLEAMSTGCIPVVTRIPSFEEMTVDGQYGRLFNPGDDSGLAQAVVELELERNASIPLREAVKRHFEAELSFTALARSLETYYQEALSRD